MSESSLGSHSQKLAIFESSVGISNSIPATYSGMIPPVVASSSSHPLWKSQPHDHHLPSSSSHSSSQNVDRWFLPPSPLDSQTLAQALSCELRSCNNLAPSSSSPKSLVKTLGSCLDAGCTTSDAQDNTALLRALIHQRQQRPSGGPVQQRGESSNLSNAASSMATSDQLKEKPGSPRKSSSASSSNSSTSMAVSGDGGAAFLPQKQQDNGVDTRASDLVGSFAKPEEGHGTASSLPWPGRITASIALSAQGSLGAGASKVTKRRSRASNKAPITVLSADTANFRAMVQKLTGIPASSSPIGSASSMQDRPFWDSSTVSILKPQPTRPSHQSFQFGSLPTLDTSAPFLLGGERGSPAFPQPSPLLPNDNLLQSAFPSLPFLQVPHQKSDSSFSAAGISLNGSSAPRSFLSAHSASDLKPLLQSNLGSSAASLPSLLDPGEVDKLTDKCFDDRRRDTDNGFNDRSRENSRMQALYVPGGGELDELGVRQVSNIESFLMEDDRQIMDTSSRSYNSVESWFSYDGTQTSKMELARNA